jgi:hypothetical protein
VTYHGINNIQNPNPQDPVNVDYLTESALRKIAGNGMSLPCAGFILLMTLLCVADQKP